MWEYQKQLEYPVNVKHPDARTAQIVLSQYGGPNGELGASLRYLSQQFAMPDRPMLGCGYNVYYAFLVKCIRFQRTFNTPKLTPMLVAERR